MTTYRPTVFFGANGNSGGKIAKEQVISGRKRSKVPKTVRKTFQPLFGGIDGISDVYRCQPRKPFNRAILGRYGKQKMAVKNVFDHRFDHLHDHNLITIGV